MCEESEITEVTIGENSSSLVAGPKYSMIYQFGVDLTSAHFESWR